MIDFVSAYSYCKDPIDEIENYQEALNDEKQTWICHHREELFPDGRLKHHTHNLILMRMYFNRPASELIFLTRSEHTRLHGKSGVYARKWSDDRKSARSKAYKGKFSGKDNPMFGKPSWNKNMSGEDYTNHFSNGMSNQYGKFEVKLSKEK